MPSPSDAMATPLDLVIDCDPGIDDALALWLAAAVPERLHLLGITCVAGNRPLHTTSANARRLMDAAGRADVPVFAGAAQPLVLPTTRCSLFHGENGLGGVELPLHRPVETEHAVDFLVRTLQDRPAGSVTLVAVGPLTNLALAEARRPGLLQRAKAVLVMGGAVKRGGNVTPRAEFNFYADPAAAEAVLQAVHRLELYGLDVTAQVSMAPAWVDALGRHPGTCARAARQMLDFYATSYAARHAGIHPLLHDACPVARLLEPGLFSGENWSLQVVCEAGADEGAVRGQPLVAGAKATGRATCEVMFDVDAARMLALTAECIARLP